MHNCRVMKFEDLVTNWRQHNCPVRLSRLLGFSGIDDADDLELYEKFKGTFWEVSCEVSSPRERFDINASYRYLSDSLMDALRLRPDAEFPYMEKLYVILNQCCAEVSDDVDFEDIDYGVFEGFDDEFSEDDELSCHCAGQLN